MRALVLAAGMGEQGCGHARRKPRRVEPFAVDRGKRLRGLGHREVQEAPLQEAHGVG